MKLLTQSLDALKQARPYLGAALAWWRQRRAAERDALTPDRIQYCQERADAAQDRIFAVCGKLERIKRNSGREG